MSLMERKAILRYLGEGLYDGAVFAVAVGEFDVAADLGSALAAAGDVRSGYLRDAGWCYGDSETCSYETKDRQPLRGLLDDSGAEAVLFAE